MKIRVNPHNVEIVREETEPVNELEIKVSKCEFEFDEAITSEFVKEAYFTLNGNTYKQIIVNNECDYPSEVLAEKGTLEIGVVAFKVENEEEIVRYNPSPDYYDTWVGSLKDAENSEPITPSEMEQFEQELQDGLNELEEAVGKAENVDISIEKQEGKTTVTITKQDGSTKSEDILDGEDGTDGENGIGLQYDWSGTSLGVKREDEALFTYVNLEGKKGDPGAINLLIVNELPLVGSEDTLYFVPKTDTEESDMYDEYVWINNDWELVGTKQITVDLDDYVKKTDYATSSAGGIIKINTNSYNTTMNQNGELYVANNNYATYQNKGDGAIIGKGTLENVITGKGLVNKTYVDNAIESNNIDVQVNNTSIVSNKVANILTEGVYGTRNKLLTKGYADARYVLEETIDDNVGYMYISPSIKDDKDVDFSINAQSNLDSEASADMNFGVEYDEDEGKGHGYFRLELYDAGSIEIDNNGTKITKVITPTNDGDAVNKLYVDSLVGDIGTILDNINGEVIGG